MARITPIPATEITALESVRDLLGSDFRELPNSVATLAHAPPVLEAVLGLWKAVMLSGNLPSQLKWLVGHAASMTAGCRYCSAHTARGAGQHGASEEKICAALADAPSRLVTKTERAAVNFAVAASTVPNAVEDSHFDELRKYLTDAQIVELLCVVAIYGFFNRFNDSNATALEFEPLSSGSGADA